MSIAAIDLNLLHVLHVVLDELHVARAAERLRVTQSAVSNALARLRDALGDPLVLRKGRGIVPTPRALELAPMLARTMGELARLLATAPFDPASCSRMFTLAVADVGQLAWGPRLAAAVARELPRAHLRIVGNDALLSLGDLGSPEIDVHLGIPARGAGIHVEPLVEVANVLVARRRHPAAGRMLSARATGELRHVRVDMLPNKRFPDPFAPLFEGVARTIAVTVPSFTSAVEVVAASDLVTMLPAPLLTSRLVALRTPLRPHAITFAMCWHDRTHLDPADAAFRALVRRVVT